MQAARASAEAARVGSQVDWQRLAGEAAGPGVALVERIERVVAATGTRQVGDALEAVVVEDHELDRQFVARDGRQFLYVHHE